MVDYFRISNKQPNYYPIDWTLDSYQYRARLRLNDTWLIGIL